MTQGSTPVAGWRGLGRWRWIALASVLLLGVSGGVTLWAWRMTPPPEPTTIDEAVAVIESDAFKRLARPDQLAYLNAAFELVRELEPERRRELAREFRRDPELRELGRQMIELRMVERAEQFARASPEQRQQMLDGMLLMQQLFRDRMSARRAEGDASESAAEAERSAPRAGSEGEGSDRLAELRAYVRQRIEHGNPQHQAYLAEMRKAMQRRQQALGIEEPDYRAIGRMVRRRLTREAAPGPADEAAASSPASDGGSELRAAPADS